MSKKRLIEYYEQTHDPVKDFFHEKLQMIFSNNHTSIILKNAAESKRHSRDKDDTTQTLDERKELRAKKFDFESKVLSNDCLDQQREIKNLIDQHEKIDYKILNHYKKECSQQEDQFQKKMRERKDRSVERSLSRSVDRVTKEKCSNRQKIFGSGSPDFTKNESERVVPNFLNKDDCKETEISQKKVVSERMNDLCQETREEEATNENDLRKEDSKKKEDSLQNDSPQKTGRKESFNSSKNNALKIKMQKMKMLNEEFDIEKKEKHTTRKEHRSKNKDELRELDTNSGKI